MGSPDSVDEVLGGQADNNLGRVLNGARGDDATSLLLDLLLRIDVIDVEEGPILFGEIVEGDDLDVASLVSSSRRRRRRRRRAEYAGPVSSRKTTVKTERRGGIWRTGRGEEDQAGRRRTGGLTEVEDWSRGQRSERVHGGEERERRFVFGHLTSRGAAKDNFYQEGVWENGQSWRLNFVTVTRIRCKIQPSIIFSLPKSNGFASTLFA